MKVYFTAASKSSIPPEILKSILDIIQHEGHQIISGLQVVEKKLLQKDTRKKATEIFNREKSAINFSDCVISEVSEPSSGVGGEIVYALMHNKPVLALFYKDAKNKLSPMIAGNPSEYLYLEHYDINNLKTLIRQFLNQVSIHQKRKGKLIVIDGGDGSGKTTQSKLLLTFLKNRGYKTAYVDYPRYYTSFHGRVVGRFLAGEFGQLDQVSPYLSSLAYAIDRAGTKEEMDECLEDGGIIVANRYATSSIAHQAAKLPRDKRPEFISWLDELEYKVHKIPREDVVIYLYVPWKIGLKLTDKKTDRGYLNGAKADIAEKDLNHRKLSEEMYLFLARTRKNWITINCVENNKILPKEIIHKKIIEILKKKKIIQI